MSERRNQRTFAEAIQTVLDRWPDALDKAPTESPVFVLAAGWRSGSTLLQRMLMAECFIWGEPYGHACMLQQLAAPLRCITGDWPEPHFFYERNVAVTLRRDEPAPLDDAAPLGSDHPNESEPDATDAEVERMANGCLRGDGDVRRLITTERDGYVAERGGLSERFIANLYPSVASVLDAHRAYFDTLFAQPARDASAVRWGVKEVRLSADYAHYLKLLYPNCKLLFLIRNPYDAYRSWVARRTDGYSHLS